MIKLWLIAIFTPWLALVSRAAGETPQTQHIVVLIDVSPSMKSYHSQQLDAVKHIIANWQPNQAVDIFAVDSNPLGRPSLAHIDPFPYDRNRSNRTRYRIETEILRKKYASNIMSAVEQAIAVEDQQNKLHPNLSQTCLIDALEAAARAFRRVSSQSRELLVLSDSYEDCRDSLHLPHERLNPARIEAMLHEFERQNRLPKFTVPTIVRFIGTRLNAASSRRYEDFLEEFWIKLLTRCGAQISTENFMPTWQGGN